MEEHLEYACSRHGMREPIALRSACGFPGIRGQLDIYRDQGYTLAVLSNYDGGASPVANKVSELLRE